MSTVKNAKVNLETARQELKDYKEKAGRILQVIKSFSSILHSGFHWLPFRLVSRERPGSSFQQAKDKVISTLRGGGGGEELLGVTSTEHEEACRERDLLRDELNQLRYRTEQLKADLQVKRHAASIGQI